MKEWISVDDRLPEKEIGREYVLGYWNGRGMTSNTIIVSWDFIPCIDTKKDNGYTHWMELPAPPEDK